MFKRLRIAPKLIVAFIIASIIASVSGVVGLVIMDSIDRQYSNALLNYGFVQGDIGKLLSSFCRVDGNVHDAVAYMDEKNQASARENVGKQAQKLAPYFDAIEPTLKTDTAKGYFQTAKTAWDKYLQKANELVEAGDTTDAVIVASVQKRLMDELDPLYMEVYDSLAALMDRKVDDGAGLSTELTQFSSVGKTVSIAVLFGAMAVSVFLGVIIARGIANPLKACSERLNKLSAGDLKSPVPVVNTRDEVGELAASTKVITDGLENIVGDLVHLLEEMGEGNFDVRSRTRDNYIGDFEPLIHAVRQIEYRLSDTLSQINQSSDQVASGSDQVSSGAQALSQGATEQASSVQELSATITEISSKVKSNAESASDASRKVEGVAEEIAASNQQMQDLIAAMREISESSSQIGQIINTIENISFQTNILALNAAVEAARAGAAGKGFAVVADEVRSLASKSNEAAKDTTVLIQSSIDAVSRGTKLADETAQSLLGVVDGAREITGTVNRISEASNEQADSINQVAVGIDQISAVVQTNSATAEESAAASEELSGQAQILKNLVSQFKLRMDAKASSRPAAVPEHRNADAPAYSDAGDGKY